MTSATSNPKNKGYFELSSIVFFTVTSVNESLLIKAEQELFHFLNGRRGRGRKNAIGDSPPASGEGRGVAASSPGERASSGEQFNSVFHHS